MAVGPHLCHMPQLRMHRQAITIRSCLNVGFERVAQHSSPAFGPISSIMNSQIGLIFLVLGLLIANAFSIALAMDKGHQWRAIYLPLSDRKFMILQIGVVLILGSRSIYELFIQPSSGRYASGLFILWYALLNGISAFYRWRRPCHQSSRGLHFRSYVKLSIATNPILPWAVLVWASITNRQTNVYNPISSDADHKFSLIKKSASSCNPKTVRPNTALQPTPLPVRFCQADFTFHLSWSIISIVFRVAAEC